MTDGRGDCVALRGGRSDHFGVWLGTHFEVKCSHGRPFALRRSQIADGQCPKHGRRQRGKMKEQMSSELSTDSNERARALV